MCTPYSLIVPEQPFPDGKRARQGNEDGVRLRLVEVGPTAWAAVHRLHGPEVPHLPLIYRSGHG